MDRKIIYRRSAEKMPSEIISNKTNNNKLNSRSTQDTRANYLEKHFQPPSLSLHPSSCFCCCTFFIPTDIPHTTDEYQTMSSRRRVSLSCCHSTHPRSHLLSNQWPCSTAAEHARQRPSANDRTQQMTISQDI